MPRSCTRSFLFAIGIAIPYAFAGRLERSGGDRGLLHRQIVRRTILLFALGLFLNWFPFYNVNWPATRHRLGPPRPVRGRLAAVIEHPPNNSGTFPVLLLFLFAHRRTVE
jgi:predicted acyltransferase